MSGFIASNIEYNITTETEVAEILSHFNSEYILNVIKDNILRKQNFYPMNPPNIVMAYDTNFKLLQNNYPEKNMDIENVRIETYKEIIEILCQEYQLQFNDIDQDYYSTAFYLYSFLLSEFSSGLISFFANFIIKEKNSIYDSIGLADMKKNKDTSTVYSKKMYKNTKLAIINANLEYVVDSICAYDISLNTVLSNIYFDKNVVKHIESVITPIYDFFKTVYVPVVQSEIKSLLLTNIRFQIQRISNDTIESVIK